MQDKIDANDLINPEEFFPEEERQEVRNSFVHNDPEGSRQSVRHNEDLRASNSQNKADELMFKRVVQESTSEQLSANNIRIIPSVSEIPLAQRTESMMKLNRAELDEMSDMKEVPKTQLVLSQKTEQNPDPSSEYYSSESSGALKKIPATAQSKLTLSGFLSFFMTISGIANMVYHNPHQYYQTPTKPRKPAVSD